MANSDKRQAALDAVQDILKARLAGQMGGMGGQGQGGEFDIDIDPDLDIPEANLPGSNGGNMEINDPDGVLDKKKQQKKQQQKQSDGGGQGGGSSDNENKEDDFGDNKGDNKDQDGQSGKQSAKGSNKSGKQSGGGSSGESSNGNDEAGDEEGSGSSSDKEDNENHDDKDGMGNSLKKSDEYVKDWNDAIDKYDNDETSDEELESQMSDSKNPQGKKDACAAIRTSRDRKLEIDPSMDKRLKMPKNSEEKAFEDSDDDETEEERQSRVDKINKELNDTAQVQKDLQDIETDIAIKKGDTMRAKQKEIDKVARKGQLMDFKDFGVDIFKTIKSQLAQAKTPDDSYNRPNPTYAGSDLLMPGQEYNDKYEKPVINVYFDQSGSWGESDIKKGIDALSSIRRFEVQKKIKINLFYFADHLHDNPRDAQWEGGTSGFDEVVKHVRDSGANNVIILTDSDIEHQTDWHRTPKVQVKGCVWYLWKRGSRSWRAPEYLSGLRDTYQYNLN